MTTPTPVQLPLTREQALAIADNWWRCPGEGVEVLLRDLGLAYAEPASAPLPEPRWPAKLVVKRRECARLLIAVDDERYGLEDWYFALSTPGHLDEAAVAEEVARRWSRCAELEEEVSVLLQRKDQAEAEWRRVALDKQQRIDALLGTLAERTRDRSCLDELRAERDAARQEAAELRRRCEWATRETNAILAQRSIAGDAMTVNAWFLGLVHQVLPVLRGQRPVPGSEGGSGA